MCVCVCVCVCVVCVHMYIFIDLALLHTLQAVHTCVPTYVHSTCVSDIRLYSHRPYRESKDSAEYKFDMEKLFMNLSQKLAENPQATYNNLLALKYEVRSLPL